MKFMELDIQRFAVFNLDVRFHSNFGTDSIVEQHIDSSAQTLNTNVFTRDGYIFTNWNSKADGTGVSLNDGVSGKDIWSVYKDDTETTDEFNSGTINIYAQWTEDISNKYVTFGGLKRYDEKIKDYIAVNSSKTELLSNYVTATGNSGSGNTEYSLNLDKILDEEFSGKLYNNVSGTVGYEGNSYYLLNADFIEIICIKTSDNGHSVVIYNGYRNKISIELNSSRDVTAGYYVGLNDYVESGNPELITNGNVPVV